ncbi:ThuA domain-containing protein [Pelagicoccus sp. SDUM812002]|uniref:ThuA domain-containing protein n=1 Tax=Pelagicoccus sp. SDUM812002 TaxID=3041266 RepID=UPI00280F517B|nr:ThuA domain-containing protein [Pelagicoccus sp. SDUM812002]MDQ8184200.1 ThuA domain-containing protein [Pelagicoccus sp. SDUM812002]
MKFLPLTAALLIAGTLSSRGHAKFEGPWPDLPANEAKRIESAANLKATAPPLRPRKLLVFSKGIEANHKSTPHGMRAFEALAKHSGAFEVVQTYDPEMLTAERLKAFDAVLFNNSNRLDYLRDESIQEGLSSFVREGKGFIGIHAATTNFIERWNSDWPEGATMLGGVFDGHPWHEKVTLQIEEPGHPLTHAFADPSFEVQDEIYQFCAPYSRENVRVLVSLDKRKTPIAHKHLSQINRRDLDFPVSWIRSYGEGRVFYCSLGHDPHIFWNPIVLHHFLDGIQYALGDLEAPDATSKTRDQIQSTASGVLEIAERLGAISEREQTPFGDELKSRIVSTMTSLSSLNETDRRALEQTFLSFLQTTSAKQNKQFVLKQLSKVATEESIQTLSNLLYSEDTFAAALQILENNPSGDATLAIAVALYKLDESNLPKLIKAVGKRGYKEPVEKLKEYLTHENEEVKHAARSALEKLDF